MRSKPTAAPVGRRRWQGLGSSDRGAVAILVGAGVALIFGMAALAIDLGNAWQERQRLHGATDAAALAAVGSYADPNEVIDGCVAGGDILADNGFDVLTETRITLSCEKSLDVSSGVVTVTATAPVDYWFAPVLGIDEGEIISKTSARYGIPISISGGLRPFGLCEDALFAAATGFADWLAGPRTTPFGPLTILYNKEQPDFCGDADGNWGQMNYDGGENLNEELVRWIIHGYEGTVVAGPGGTSCDATIPPESCYLGNTGAFRNSLDNALNSLVAGKVEFSLPLFDSAINPGDNALFNITGFLRVVLLDFKTTGPEADRFLTFDVVSGVGEGVCCDPNGVDTGIRVIQICGVETKTSCGAPTPEPTATDDD